jgi:hypothetical protein
MLDVRCFSFFLIALLLSVYIWASHVRNLNVNSVISELTPRR